MSSLSEHLAEMNHKLAAQTDQINNMKENGTADKKVGQIG